AAGVRAAVRDGVRAARGGPAAWLAAARLAGSSPPVAHRRRTRRCSRWRPMIRCRVSDSGLSLTVIAPDAEPGAAADPARLILPGMGSTPGRAGLLSFIVRRRRRSRVAGRPQVGNP